MNKTIKIYRHFMDVTKSVNDAMVLTAYVDGHVEKGFWYGSDASLVVELGLKDHSVLRSRKRLVADGFIVSNRSMNGSKVYLTDDFVQYLQNHDFELGL